MAKGTYVSKNISEAQLNLFKVLEEHEWDIFSLEQARAHFKDMFNDLESNLENLVQKGLLSRLERGKYCKAGFRDENVIGTWLTPDGVVAYWSALNLHGLTDQFPNKVFIQTTHKKSDKSVFGVEYRFVSLNTNKIAGTTTEGRGSHKFKITDIEKTIIDCFDRPEYSGGYEELIKAFTHTLLVSDKLVKYSQLMGNKALIKRMGYLAELSETATLNNFIAFARDQVNERYSLIDPFGENIGEFVNGWKIRLNIPKENLLRIVTK